jgi:hypothetical protein
MDQLSAHAGASKLSRDQLATILPPEPTETFKPISHAELIHNVLDGLSYRHINVVRDEYAVSDDGNRIDYRLDSIDGCFNGVACHLTRIESDMRRFNRDHGLDGAWR